MLLNSLICIQNGRVDRINHCKCSSIWYMCKLFIDINIFIYIYIWFKVLLYISEIWYFDRNDLSDFSSMWLMFGFNRLIGSEMSSLMSNSYLILRGTKWGPRLTRLTRRQYGSEIIRGNCSENFFIQTTEDLWKLLHKKYIHSNRAIDVVIICGTDKNNLGYIYVDGWK